MRLRLRAGGFLALAVVAITCTDVPTSPKETRGATLASGHLRMSPSFSPAAARIYGGLAAFGIEVTEVHVVLTAPDGSTRDTTISFPPGQDTLFIDIPIPSGQTDQTFTALLELRNDQHVVLFSGTQTVVARSANLPPLSTPVVVIQYTGPGTKTKTVTVSPPDTTVPASASVPFRASAVDSSGGTVTDLLVRWTTSDASIATATTTGNASAAVAGQGRRGVTTISAITPSGITGSTRITFVPPPARLVVVSGGAQTGVAGSVLAQPFVVEVQAADNLPVPGAIVTFRSVAAGGSVTTASAITGSTGRASTTLTLGRTSGTYQYEAASGALAPVTVTETATPAPPAAVGLVSGDQQVDSVGRTLSLPLVVKVTDQFGGPVAGASVTWTRLTGTGAPGAASTTTAIDGVTSTTYTLGNTARTETVSASIAGVSGTAGTATFSMRAISRGAGALSIVSGGGQSGGPGTTLAAPLVARAVDALNNPVPNVTVVWSAQGGSVSFSNATALTDVAGQVTTNVALGSTAGTVPVTATAGTLAAATTLTIVAGPAAIISKVAGDGQSASVATNVATAPSVRVTDVAGNPIQGASVAFAVASGGGSATGTATSTNASGIATVGSWKVGAASGANTLTATSGALSTTFTATATAVGPNTLALVQPVPATITVGVPFTAPVQVQLRDASGNSVAQAGVVITATGTVLPANTSFVLTATTAASGVASFNLVPYSGSTGTLVFTLTSPGVTTLTTSAITILTGAASRLAIGTQPSSSATSGAPFVAQPGVQLTDDGSNPVSVSGVSIVASISSGGGTLGGTTSTTTNGAGLATFTNLSITGTPGSRVLLFTSVNQGVATSAPISVGVGAPASIARNTGNAQTATAGTAVSVPPSVLVTDAANNPVPGAAVTFAVTGGGGSVTLPSATTNASGVATVGSWTLGSTAGANALTATSGALNTTFSATGIAGAAGKLIITTQPSTTGTVGAALGQQPVVQLADAAGNPVALSGVQVTATIVSGTGTLTNAQVTTSPSGTVNFIGLAITGAAGPYVLQFNAPGVVPATSGTVTLTVGPAAALSITTQPAASAQSGVALAPQPAIQLRDAGGNIVSAPNVVVNVNIAAGGGTITSSTSSTNAAGVATFSGLTLTGAPGPRTLQFTGGGLLSVTSSAVNLTPGAPATMAYNAGNLQSAQIGTAVSVAPSVLVNDAGGFPVPNTPVVFAIASGGGTATGLNTTTNASGIATIGSWTLGSVAGGNTLTATAGSASITFSATGTSGSPARFVPITNAPTSITVGVPIPGPQQLQVADAANNPVSQAGIAITLTLSVQPGNGITTYNAVTNAAGIASFSLAPYIGVSGTGTLTATATGFTPLVSPAFTILPGSPTQLGYLTQPQASAAAGVILTPQPVLQIEDAGGNPLSLSQNVVASIATGTGATVGGTTTNVTNAQGQTRFNDLSINGTTGVYTLKFTLGSIVSANSNNITISVGPTSNLGLNGGNGQQATVGTAVAVPPSVKVVDAFNNPLPGVGVTFSVGTPASQVSGGGALGSSTIVQTNASGIAALTQWVLGNTAQSYSVSATAAVNNGSPVVFTATAVAASGTRLSITTAPSSAATNGAALATQPVIQLQDAGGNLVNTAGVVVTATLASGSGTLANASATTVAGGAATFSGLAITGTAGQVSLQFSSAGYTPVTSAAMTLSAGAATQIIMVQQPSTPVQSGAPFAPQPSVRLADASGNPVSQSGIVIGVAIQSGGGTLNGPATATTDASGFAVFSNLSISGSAGPRTLFFAAAGVAGVQSATISVTAGTGTQLALTTVASSTATNGVALSAQPVVQLKDATGNSVATAGVVVTASITGGAGTLTNATATTNASGTATFSGLTITGTSGTFTLQFSAPSYTPVSVGTIFVNPGALTQIVVTPNPASLGAGATQQFTAVGQDASNNVVSITPTWSVINGGGAISSSGVFTAGAAAGSFTNTVQASSGGINGVASVSVIAGPVATITVTPNPASLATGGTQQFTAVAKDAQNNVVAITPAWQVINGGGSISATGLFTAGTTANTFNNTVHASASAISGFASVTVNAGAPSVLALASAPSSSATNGVALTSQPAIQLKDANGNAVALAGVTVTAGVTTGTGSLTNNQAVTNTNGLATFSGLTITGIAGNYVLQFNEAGYTGVSTGTIVLGAGAPTQLAIVTQPSPSVQSGVTFPVQPVIQLTDASGNSVSNLGVTVTVAILNGAGTLGGTLTASTNGGGTATFTNLVINGPLGGRDLRFTTTLPSSVVANTVNVAAGSGTQLAISTPPAASATSGSALGQQPVVQLKDATGNNVSTSGVVVTATIATGSGTLTNAAATTSATGAASFSGLTLTGTAGSWTLQFSAGGYAPVNSSPITVSAGPLSAIAISPIAPTLTPGLTQQFTAVGTDASNNVVSITPTWSVANGGGTITGAGLFTAGNTAGNFVNTVRAQSGAILGTASVLVTAGSGSQLTITTPPSNGATNGVALAVQPVVQLKDAFNNSVTTAGVVVTASIATGSGSLVNASATTAAGGAATFSGLAITGVAGGFTLAFDAPGYSTTTSGPITLSAGAPAAITISAVPSSQIRSGILIPQAFDIQIRDTGGNPVAQAGVPVAAAITGGGALSGTLTVNTNASGLASFTNLTWTGLAGPNSFGFSSAGLSSAAYGPIALAAGNASTLVLATTPSTSATSGVALTTQPRVQLQDGGGNVIAQASVQVTASVTPASGTVTNTVATTTGSGTATFGALTISGPPGSYVLQFNASGLTPVSSASIALAAGAPTQLVVVSAPITAGILTTNPVIVEARDAGNIPVGGVSINILAAGGAIRNGTPSATTLTTLSNGQVSFNWKLSNRAKTDTLSLTASGVSGPNYALATATAGPASVLAFGTQPAGSTGGIAMPAFTVFVADSGGVDTVSTTGQVAISIKSGTGAVGATASGTLSVAPVNGVATFTGVAIDLANPAYQFDATLSGLLAGVSSPFAITTGAAAQLRYVQQPTNAIATVAIAPAVTVELTDAGGNRVTSNSTSTVNVGITAASGTSGAVLTGGTAVTLASGVATFPALSIDLTGSAYTLIAGSNLGSFTKISSTFDITPNSPASVTTLSGPKQVGIAMGQIPAGIIKFLVKNAAGTPVPAGTTVNLSTTFPAVCGPATASMTTASNGTVSPQVIIQANSGSCEVIAQVAGVTQRAFAQVVVPTAGSTHVWFGGANPNTISFDQASNWAVASAGYTVATAAPSSSADKPYVPFWPLTGGQPVLQSDKTVGDLFVEPGVRVNLNTKTLTTGSVLAHAAGLDNGTVVVRGTNVNVSGQFFDLTIGGGGSCGTAARESAYVGFVVVAHAMKVLCTAIMDSVAAVDFAALTGSKVFVRPGALMTVSDTAAFEGDSLFIGDTATVYVSGRATFGGAFGMDARSGLVVGGTAAFHGLGALYGGSIRVDGNVTFGGAGSAGYTFNGGVLDLGGNFTQLPGLTAQTFRASNYHYTSLISTVQPQTITMSDRSNELDNVAVQSTMGATLLTDLNLAASSGALHVNGASLTISSGKALLTQRLYLNNNAFLTDNGTITLSLDDCYFDGTYVQGTTITGTGTINGRPASTYVCQYFNGGSDKLPVSATLRSKVKRDPMAVIRARMPAARMYVNPRP